MEDWQMEDTLPRRVVITPTLIIPAYVVKRKKPKNRAYRWTFALIIFTWLLLLAITTFLVWSVLIYARH
jgi:hypothetical protein